MYKTRFIKITVLDKDKNETTALINLDHIVTVIQEKDFTRVYLVEDCEISVKESLDKIFEALNII